jgi:hypothetical protein
MNIQDTVKLMLKSSDHNPYSGKLSKKDNVMAAVDLAKLCLDFAEKGHSDEAMNLDSEHWKKVINELELLRPNCA